MITHNLVQGSAAWLAYRTTHFNASDAPVMLGMSPYKTRSQLLHELHTGLVPEVDASTQSRFDAGHAAEAAARPLAEEIIGEELYPVTGSEGKLSASFDGLTMGESIVWEHKLMNAALADSLANGVIPEQYHPQLEQQLMVSGAENALFMASSSDGTAEAHAWYTSRPELRAAILQGWTQFAIDLESYTPAGSDVPVIGKTPETLPALRIEVTGMVTASNLADFKAHALAVFAGINRDLVTDADFANAEKTVKWAGDVEDRLAAAKQHALSQTASIDELFRTIDDISAEARRVRLELDKLVKARKDSIRAEIVADGRNAMADHIAALNKRIGKPLMPNVLVDFANAIKGKRTLDSMRDAVATELARVKIAANEMADKITLNLRALNEAPELAFLFADVAQLALKDPEFVAMAIKNRIADHQAKEAARLEAERARIANEERIKAEAAATARANAEIAAAAAASQTQAAQAIAKAAAPAISTPADPVPYVAPVQQPDTGATMRLGQISERLGFTVTADFLSSLGFEPCATDKNAKLYKSRVFPLICRELVRHINSVSAGEFA
jgi:putative phage-type endonuclease